MTSYSLLAVAIIGYGFFSLQTIFTWEILFFLMNPHFIAIFLFAFFYGIILSLKQRSFNLTYIRNKPAKSKNLTLEPLSHRDFYFQFNHLVMKNPEYRSTSQILLRDHSRLYIFTIFGIVVLLSIINTAQYRQLPWIYTLSLPLFGISAYLVAKRVKKIYHGTTQKMFIEQVSIATFLEWLHIHGINFHSRTKTTKEKQLIEFLELCASLQLLHHQQNRRTLFNVMHGLIDACLGILLVMLPPAGSPLMLKYIGYTVILGSVLYVGIIGAKYLQNREITRLSQTILEPFLILP